MKRHSIPASLALAVLAVLGLAGPVAAQVPFLGRLEGSFTVAAVNLPFVDEVLTATGNATHLGKFKWVMPHRIDVSTKTLAGTFQMTAANGDTVYGTLSGKSSPTPTPGVVQVMEIYTFTGGTGRFAGATGGFIMQRLVNFVTTKSTGAFKGTIYRRAH